MTGFEPAARDNTELICDGEEVCRENRELRTGNLSQTGMRPLNSQIKSMIRITTTMSSSTNARL